MSASDGCLSDVDEEESQATQLIHAALEQSPKPSEGRDKSGIMGSNKDASIQSFRSSKNSTATPAYQYHFHGLASTQTQTQPYDEEDSVDSGLMPNEDSQKENMGATGGKNGKDIRWGMPSPDSRPSSPHRLAAKDNVATAGRSGTPGRLTKSPVKSLISQQATMKTDPQSTKTKGKLPPPQASRRRNSRSRSPQFSQDSFAQGDSQLSEEKFLVTSKKFTMPLADLARADEDDYSTEFDGQARLPQSNPSTYDRDDRPPVILVPSTPSQSESSDYSRDESSRGRPPPLPHLDDSFEQGQSAGRIILDSDSSRGPQHSQGFDGQDEVAEVQDLYSNKRDTESRLTRHHPLSGTTGFQEIQEATQIATQEALMPTVSSIIPQTNTSTHTGPRSLLSTMDPHKRNRYQHLVHYTPASPVSPAQQFPAGTGRWTTDGAETQLLEVPDRPKAGPSLLAAQPPRVPSPRKVSPEKMLYQRPRAPSAVDAMDVIPDSEPMREMVQTSVSEERLMDVDAVVAVQGGGRISKRSSHDSEATEDSDILPPKKFARREEEEEVTGHEEGEEEDDDDDDEPLSARLRKEKGKAPDPIPGKRDKPSGATRTYASRTKADKKATKARPAAAAKRNEPLRRQKAQKAARNTRTTTMDKAHESTVPSSVPDQDHPRTRKPSLKATMASKDKGKQPVRKASKATSVVRSTRSHHSATVEADKDSDIDMDEISDSEEATEPAMDEGSDYMEPEVPPQNLKRKRGRPPKSKSLNTTTTTPRTRLTKRLKSAGSTISRVGATRVFAFWSGNSLYYSGVIHEHMNGNEYNVKFDDGNEGVVSTDDMRTHNLRVGDLVRIDNKAKDHKVVQVNNRTDIVSVDILGEAEELPLKEIGISAKMIASMWQDRQVDKRAITPVMRIMDTKPTPSPSRSAASFRSLNAKGSRPSHKFLQKVGLIVSLSGNNTNDRTKDGRSRSDILNAVRDSGGVVVDDLFKYLRMDISYSSNRWIGELADIQWIGEPKELDRLFLLADDCNLKPKYLMALALGIPCLSINWLYSCLEVGKELDWRPYLLPQGRPTTFDVLPSQQVDLNWGDQREHLVAIMSNPIAPRVLKDQSVLCVGPDMTPKSKDTDKAGEPANYIIRIILAMGATRVEAVRDISHASNTLSHYDLLVIREKDHYHRSYIQTHTVDWNWVKDSLIMSRLLPYPDWASEEESQCSQSL